MGTQRAVQHNSIRRFSTRENYWGSSATVPARICILGLFRERMAVRPRPVDFSVLVLIQANPNVNQKACSRSEH
jgi:hypothetical protein